MEYGTTSKVAFSVVIFAAQRLCHNNAFPPVFSMCFFVNSDIFVLNYMVEKEIA